MTSHQAFQKKSGKSMNVQTETEKPDVYVSTRCPSGDHELTYSDTRNEDIRLLRHSIEVEDLNYTIQ